MYRYGIAVLVTARGWSAVSDGCADRHAAMVCAVCRPITAPCWTAALSPHTPTVLDPTAAADAAQPARAVHRRASLEVDPQQDHRHRHAHVPEVFSGVKVRTLSEEKLTTKALRYGTRCKEISQLYRHISAFIDERNEP